MLKYSLLFAIIIIQTTIVYAQKTLLISERPATGTIEIIDLGDGVKLEMVYIRGGSFQMGSPNNEEGRWATEGPIHTGNLPDFRIGKYEVTQAQWKAVMHINPSNWQEDDLPVEQVSWNDCKEFIAKLNSKTGKTFCLPSEAQWEYACRAGSTTKFCFGDSYSKLDDYAWYSFNSDKKTHPVGQKKPNAWGLYDMHGNVWEWCEDYYHNSYNKAPTDGSVWMSPKGEYRVLRGGSWGYYPRFCRSASRFNYSLPVVRRIHDGVRLIMIE